MWLRQPVQPFGEEMEVAIVAAERLELPDRGQHVVAVRPGFAMSLADQVELFGEGEPSTWRAMLEHVRLMDEADLSFPVILSSSGFVMDGMHRVAKALRQGRADIEAVQFDEDPPPDHVGLGPDDLTY